MVRGHHAKRCQEKIAPIVIKVPKWMMKDFIEKDFIEYEELELSDEYSPMGPEDLRKVTKTLVEKLNLLIKWAKAVQFVLKLKLKKEYVIKKGV